QVALAEQWRAWGVTPAAVLGHSLGEYAAAWLSGVISLEDAVKLVAARGRLFDSIPTSGLMAAVFAPEVQVLPYLASFGGRVETARKKRLSPARPKRLRRLLRCCTGRVSGLTGWLSRRRLIHRRLSRSWVPSGISPAACILASR
ncbi:MAG: acyltransferase domain-containing protein, partial [Candidatus Omnitrophica bacterium]|nr:acyltransferase domain-containing protein [Candidatus Omnitrophota bacterium]